MSTIKNGVVFKLTRCKEEDFAKGMISKTSLSVIPQFSEKKLNFFFSFFSCSVALGFGVLGGIPQETVDLLAFFLLGSGAQMGERVWAIDFDPVDGSPPPPLLPNPSRPPLPLPNLLQPPPLPLSLLPLGSSPLPSQRLPPPSRSPPPHAARIEKRRSTLN
jgi:hypothetical protein